MRHPLFYLILVSILSLPNICTYGERNQHSERVIYKDTEFGTTVWRMTTDPADDRNFYYTSPSFSPDGRFIIFFSNRKRSLGTDQYLFIMNADGSDIRPLGGDYWQTIHNSNTAYDIQSRPGVWSKDSSTYYVGAGLLKIDIKENKVTPVYGRSLPFYNPKLSPDGRLLAGLSIKEDSCLITNQNGYCFKQGEETLPGGIPHIPISKAFIEIIDLTRDKYSTFRPPLEPIPDKGGIYLDYDYGWLGQDSLFLQSYTVETTLEGKPFSHGTIPVVSLASQKLTGYLNFHADNNDWANGLFAHISLDADAAALGDGLIAGHGRGFEIANSHYRYPPASRGWHKLNETGNPYWDAVGNHSNFSPDGRWIVVENLRKQPGVIVAYPVKERNPRANPFILARFRPEDDYYKGDNIDWRGEFEYPWPTWSPDGTKVIFHGNAKDPNNSDIYIAIFDPDNDGYAVKPVTNVHITYNENGEGILTFNPPQSHREIKGYEIGKLKEDGKIEVIDTLPQVVRYIVELDKGYIDEKTDSIKLDSVEGLPDSGVIELAGMSSIQRSELVRYNEVDRGNNMLLRCERGVLGTTPAKHWNGGMVWLHTGEHGYVLTEPGIYKVRAVEWSGLTSKWSDQVELQEKITGGEGETGDKKQGDTSGPGTVSTAGGEEGNEETQSTITSQATIPAEGNDSGQTPAHEENLGQTTAGGCQLIRVER